MLDQVWLIEQICFDRRKWLPMRRAGRGQDFPPVDIGMAIHERSSGWVLQLNLAPSCT